MEKEDAGFKLEFKVRDETRVELELNVQFGELIEFLDDGSQGGVSDRNDTIISIINLDELVWRVTRAEERSSRSTCGDGEFISFSSSISLLSQWNKEMEY
ncbi:MAG: hypothetical protein O6846_01810 [Thaumarchaeota archaeon]|nr:hypothetical protein [Nitrososphaerota archaeon]